MKLAVSTGQGSRLLCERVIAVLATVRVKLLRTTFSVMNLLNLDLSGEVNLTVQLLISYKMHMKLVVMLVEWKEFKSSCVELIR